MEAIIEIAATIIYRAIPVEGGEIFLGADGRDVKKGMFIVYFADDLAPVKPLLRIDGNEIVLFGAGLLKTVHPIDGAGGRFAVLVDDTIVPAAPCEFLPGHDRFIRMQDGAVMLVLESAEHEPFFQGRIGEESEGLVGVAGEDDPVKAFFVAVRSLYDHFAVIGVFCAAGGRGLRGSR